MKKIPNISLNLTNGSVFETAKIKKKTILFFYPKSFTPGCTIEVNEFQKHLNKFKKLNIDIIGASKDPVEKNIKFASEYKLQYPLGSDESKSCEKLGIWVEKSMYGKKYFGIDRYTFMIDSKGKIFKQWNKVKVKGHVKEVLEYAKNCP